MVEYRSNHNDDNNNGAIKHKDIKNSEYIYRLIMPSTDLINKHFQSKAVTLEYKSKERLKLGNRLSKLVEFINDPSNNWIVKENDNATAKVYFAYKNKIQLYKEMELDSSNHCIMALQKGSIAKDSTVDFQRRSKNTKLYMTKEPCKR